MPRNRRAGPSRRTLAAVALALAGCAVPDAAVSPTPAESPATAPPQEPEVPPVDQGLLVAQAWLAAEIGQNEFLDVRFDGAAIDLTPPCTLDIGYGGGHVGSLAFVRLSVAADTTRCERLSWQSYRRRGRTPGGEASRGEVATSVVQPLLDGVRALSQAVVSERPRSDHTGTTLDFFVLVRVCRDDASADRTWEFAGYMSSYARVRYVATEAVVDKAREILDPLPWKPVDVEDYRRTHFPDAFARNRDLYTKDFHWWVMERSVEMLGWFGDRSAIPTVEWVRDNSGDLRDRQIAKIRHVLAEPATYLDGPPREIPEK